ncbi:hypothetical protein [Streptomyces showdoensis]|uniref:Uncharacterized protein n=1 Tax=Streptomyces showdoensis TaxID=68268 RepID=A0A2P2GR74_STREW|nr:hypothetical protein [Streptomyces showdoensis]KKZ73994.1 hypothetical protein VO63_10325 [Streptomyces showdoensis]
MTDTREPSGALRLALRVDAFTSTSRGIVLVTAVLLALVFTGTTAGIAAAVVLFLAWCAVGYLGRRHQKLSGRTPTAGDR